MLNLAYQSIYTYIWSGLAVKFGIIIEKEFYKSAWGENKQKIFNKIYFSSSSENAKFRLQIYKYIYVHMEWACFEVWTKYPNFSTKIYLSSSSENAKFRLPIYIYTYIYTYGVGSLLSVNERNELDLVPCFGPDGSSTMGRPHWENYVSISFNMIVL